MANKNKDFITGGDYMFNINTLGKFEIYSKGVKITESSKRSVRVWNLFKYILAHRKKMIPADELIEAVWGEKNLKTLENPEKALQNLIYRLRTSLSLAVQAEDLILFYQDCYQWNEKFPIWIDVDVLTECHKKGLELVNSSPYEAIQCFEKVIKLYKGEFLNDIYDIWVIPLRTTYKKAYSESVLSLVKIFDKHGDFESVVRVCNTFFKYELFDEKVHFYFLKAFVFMDKKADAQKYYDVMAKALYREFGIPPSYTFDDILKSSKEYRPQKEIPNIDAKFIKNILFQDKSTGGSYLCDVETFSAISKIKARNSIRSGVPAIMILATFTENSGSSNISATAENVNIIEEAKIKLVNTLRKGDVICHWNPNQSLIMLSDHSVEEANMAMERVNKKLQAEILHELYDINCEIFPITR